MVGFELKALVVILLMVTIIINFITYKEIYYKGKGFGPSKSFWYLLFTSFGLFIYGLYLNENPIILF